MQASASYVTRSRHGNIWYYRWVVPARLRQLYPQLLRELKRSTGTAGGGFVNAEARGFWIDFLFK